MALVRQRVVLYNPTALFWTMPLALVAIGSALDPDRFEVTIVDGRLEDTRKLLQRVEGALCLGITVLTGRPLGEALAVSRLVRQRYPELPIIWGGWHPSLFPEQCALEPAVTAAVVGQGEETFRELVGRLASGSSLDGVAGCQVSDGAGGLTTNPLRPLRDLDSLPPHNYGLIEVETYFERKGRRQIDYVTSQGCRFRCSFCADPAVYRRSWTGLEPERVVGELQQLQRRHGFDDVGFQDETFFTSPTRVAEIAEGLLAAGLRCSWSATLRADQGRRMGDELFALCRASGLRNVVLGLESGSEETLRAIRKDITLDDVWDTAEKLRRHGIGAAIGVIVGFPGEPEESVLASLDAARRLRELSPDFRISVFYYQPYPGNEIADRLARDGHALPRGLEEWAEFDYVGGSPRWLSDEQRSRVDNFRFYQQLAYDRVGNPLALPLSAFARWRVRRHAYRLPLERRIIERIRPKTRLS
jgi:radical SAM superfamily enzyme YgiQ (UPF0313 family)